MSNHSFNEKETLKELQHFLPAQAPLKDFIHHNTLHGFQHHKFFTGIESASQILGYKVLLNHPDYVLLFKTGQIAPEVLLRTVGTNYPDIDAQSALKAVLSPPTGIQGHAKVGRIRSLWKKTLGIDLDETVHPLLFRLLCTYLDQGIAIWDFPTPSHAGFLQSVRLLCRNGIVKLFNNERVHALLFNEQVQLKDLLEMVVGPNEEFFEHYLFDQQFAHHGWSGLVATVEEAPETLLKQRKISLRDLIHVELLLEIDVLDSRFGKNWKPVSLYWKGSSPILFEANPHPTDSFKALSTLHEAFEWTYYDRVLAGVHGQALKLKAKENPTFQAVFCLDDRECSIRRYIEASDPTCKTYGTPGFFSIEFYYQPAGGKFHTKLCPAPITPKYLIKEVGGKASAWKDLQVSKASHSLGRGLLLTQTIGFWSAARLILSIFRPQISSSTASSFHHMSPDAQLTIEFAGEMTEDGLQVGFKIEEMADRIDFLLQSIGMTSEFAPLVYFVGHGSSSTNNPHYAAYDCGACSGRPGSVNARVAAFMANHPGVRSLLKDKGLTIPDSTRFIGALHDTSRDEIQFYDTENLNETQARIHDQNKLKFVKALDNNAKERSRRLDLVNTRKSAVVVHEKMKLRSVSLFETRPELNHATNALCVVGRRELTEHLFLDRRCFLNSYDYRNDADGKYLLGILKAAAPVCGGINLEYFFSRTDNEKLGAGSKLPHNVMGLFGVANGYEGDLRPGLPKQMIELHDPVRLLIIVEHFHQIVLKVIQAHEPTLEWFANHWVHLVCIEPDTGQLMRFDGRKFITYELLYDASLPVQDAKSVIEHQADSVPVFILQDQE